MRGQDSQWNWVFYTGLAACVAGILLSPFIASALPFGLDGQVAALIMKADRWDAGWTLLRAGYAGDANDAAAGFNLVQANRAALVACQEAVNKEGQDQRCTIIVKAPMGQ